MLIIFIVSEKEDLMILKDKVSILIPVYNREKLIEQTVRSAMNQTYKNIEIIIVDNKSTDNTWEILNTLANQDNRIKIFQNETNIGPVLNWKRCINEANGEYVKILWSDDLIAPTFIEKTLPFVVDNEDVGFVFTTTEIFYDNTNKRLKTYNIGETGIYYTQLYIESSLLGESFEVPVSPGNALFRKKDIDKNLLVDIPNKIGSDFKMHAIGNDALIYLLTAKDYPKFAFVNEILAFFRAHNGSISISTNQRNMIILYNLAKTYFVENYLTDKRLIKKFNAKLWLILIKNGSIMNISKVHDFYFNKSEVKIDYLYLFKFIIKKLFKYFKNQEGKNGTHK